MQPYLSIFIIQFKTIYKNSFLYKEQFYYDLIIKSLNYSSKKAVKKLHKVKMCIALYGGTSYIIANEVFTDAKYKIVKILQYWNMEKKNGLIINCF